MQFWGHNKLGVLSLNQTKAKPTYLTHESWNDAMELGALEMQRLS
jgi:hypothetical protein